MLQLALWLWRLLFCSQAEHSTCKELQQSEGLSERQFLYQHWAARAIEKLTR